MSSTRFAIAALTGIAVGIFSIAANTQPAAAAQPVPAGRPVGNGTIVFTRVMGNDPGIYTVNVATGSTVRTADSAVTPPGVVGSHFSWSPDGAQFMWTGQSGDDEYRTQVVNADGTDPHPVSIGGRDFEGSWSPDGTHVTFVRMDPATARYGIWVERVDGADARLVTSIPDANASTPRFSPDGTTIIFSADFAPVFASRVYVVNVDGSGLHQVGPATGWNLDPTFSPDGQAIAFAVDDDHVGVVGAAAGIYTMAADGTNVHQLTHGLDVSPDWQRVVAPPARTTATSPTVQHVAKKSPAVTTTLTTAPRRSTTTIRGRVKTTTTTTSTTTKASKRQDAEHRATPKKSKAT